MEFGFKQKNFPLRGCPVNPNWLYALLSFVITIMTTMFDQLWNDYQLNWEPTEFGGINVIRILPEKVWKPDIVLFNKSASLSPL